MKNFKIVMVISLLGLISCSHINGEKREIASLGSSQKNEISNNQSLHTTIMAKQGVKYKVEIFKPRIKGCFAEKNVKISPIEIKKNDEYENLKDNVQVATVRFSANYGDRENCKYSLAEGVINLEFNKPTIVKIIEEAPYSFQLGGINSQYYSDKKGTWTPGQEMKFDEFYKD